MDTPAVTPFKRIDHVELVTADPERAIRFYGDAFGFTVRRRDHVASTPLGSLDLVYLDLGGTTIELMTYPDAKLDARDAGERLGYRMMAIEVDDIDAALTLLASKGIKPTWGPIKRTAYARAEVRDPDGNAIELRQWVA